MVAQNYCLSADFKHESAVKLNLHFFAFKTLAAEYQAAD